jgi:hypothetical protein
VRECVWGGEGEGEEQEGDDGGLKELGASFNFNWKKEIKMLYSKLGGLEKIKRCGRAPSPLPNAQIFSGALAADLGMGARVAGLTPARASLATGRSCRRLRVCQEAESEPRPLMRRRCTLGFGTWVTCCGGERRCDCAGGCVCRLPAGWGVTATVAVGKKIKGRLDLEIPISAKDSDEVVAEQWGKLRTLFVQQNTAIIFHLKNHYGVCV